MNKCRMPNCNDPFFNGDGYCCLSHASIHSTELEMEVSMMQRALNSVKIKLNTDIEFLEKENAKLKDTNFMVENFHKLGLENEALKDKVEYFDRLSGTIHYMKRDGSTKDWCLKVLGDIIKEANADE